MPDIQPLDRSTEEPIEQIRIGAECLEGFAFCVFELTGLGQDDGTLEEKFRETAIVRKMSVEPFYVVQPSCIITQLNKILQWQVAPSATVVITPKLPLLSGKDPLDVGNLFLQTFCLFRGHAV